MSVDSDYHALVDAAVRIATGSYEDMDKDTRAAANTFLRAEFEQNANGWVPSEHDGGEPDEEFDRDERVGNE